jgi:hypothetical protein
MIAGLALGGPLRADASRGTSGVFINGRHITAGEKAYIEQLCQTPVAPARYWILFNGLDGYEGGPAVFNLWQCPGLARQSIGARSMSKTYCDANGNCTSTGVLGYITTTPRSVRNTCQQCNLDGRIARTIKTESAVGRGPAEGSWRIAPPSCSHRR